MAGTYNVTAVTPSDYRRLAEKRLPRFLFDYIDGGAGAEVTLRRNTADWEAVQLRQKVLVDASKLDCSVDLFGEKLALPLVLAPVGMGGMTARRGEVQAKRAADAVPTAAFVAGGAVLAVGTVAVVAWAVSASHQRGQR